MSMLILESKSIVTIPASTSKLITGVNVAGILNSVLPEGIAPDSIITPKNIRMTHESARSSLGAKASPKAIIEGFLYLTLAHAYGQGKPEVLSKGCPAWAATGLARACDHFKAGAGGVTAPSLATAVQAAVDHLLALPKPVKAKAINSPAVITSTSTVVEDVINTTTGRITSHSLAFGHEAHEDGIRAGDAELINAPFLASSLAEIAMADAEKRAAEQQDIDFVAVIKAAAVNRPEFALEQLKAAASALGYRLVRESRKSA